MSNDDPFQRRDTRPYFGKTDRRESHRAYVSARLRVVPDDGEPDDFRSVMGSLSLNGFFVHPDEAGEDLAGKKIDLVLELADEGEVELRLPVKTPAGRPGFIVRLDSLDFEEMRKVARYLDEKSSDNSQDQPPPQESAD